MNIRLLQQTPKLGSVEANQAFQKNQRKNGNQSAPTLG